MSEIGVHGFLSSIGASSHPRAYPGRAGGGVPEAARQRDPRGFTLVEMLVALVITGVLGAAVTGLLLNQNRFYGETSDLVFAEQTLRGAAELMGSELRMASAEDITEQTSDAVTVRFTTHRAVVRNVSGGNVELYVYDVASNANVGGAWTTLYWDSGTDAWVADGDALDAEPGGTGVTTMSWDGPALDAGTPIRVVRSLRYHFAPSTFTSGTALWRGNQELAAPFESDASFQYVTSGGEVTAIRVQATAIGEGTNRYDVSRDLDYTISLRN